MGKHCEPSLHPSRCSQEGNTGSTCVLTPANLSFNTPFLTASCRTGTGLCPINQSAAARGHYETETKNCSRRFVHVMLSSMKCLRLETVLQVVSTK